MVNFADLTTESGRFWTKATNECLRGIFDGMTSVKCRHTNFRFVRTNLGPLIEVFHYYAFSFLGTPVNLLRNPV